MASVDQHVARATRNQQFAEHFDLDTTEFRDWVVTGYFYSSLHWIDAYLTKINKKTDDGHASRNTLTNTERELTGISRAYRKLFSYSQNARYELIDFSPQAIRQDVIPKVIQIRTCIEHLLSN